MKNCFKDTRVIATDGFTNALLEFKNGRADALMWDDSVLVGVARRTGPSSSRAIRSWRFRTASGSSRGTRRSSAGSTHASPC